jgi:hypothetical protein
MKTSIVNINKKLAEYLLEFNIGNRKLRDRTVRYFADCLKEGSFHTTHQGVAIQGTIKNPIRILDGQHRLAAIAATGIPAEILVSEEASIACFENVDNGLPRALCDRAGIKGKEASICSVFYYLCSEGRLHKPSVDRIKAIYDLIRPVLQYVPLPGVRGISLSGFSAAFVLQQKVYGFNDCDEFSSFDSQKISNLAINKPLLFNLKTRQSQHSTRKTFTHAESFCAIWDCVSNRNLKRLTIRGDATDRAMGIIKQQWPELYRIASSFDLK